MRITFRQGIVKHQPNFLQVNSSTIDLLASVNPFVITFTYKDKDYLHVEVVNVPNAWHGLLPNVDQWLYVDIDISTITIEGVGEIK